MSDCVLTASREHSDLANPTELERLRRQLAARGWALTSCDELELHGMHERIAAAFFAEGKLGPEVPGFPVNRLHSRDVVDYRRTGERLIFEERTDTTSPPVLNMKARREYKRAHVLSDEACTDFVSAVLNAVPPSEALTHGGISIDFVRTFDDLVAKRHQDGGRFVAILVVTREARGAVTSMYALGDPDETVVELTLYPGDILILRDTDFIHDATPLRPRYAGDSPYRDAVLLLILNEESGEKR